MWLGFSVLFWIKVARVGVLILFFICEWRFPLCTVEYYVSCGLVICDLYLCWGNFPLYPVCLEFHHKIRLNFVNCICSICWDDYMIFISCFVNVVLIDLGRLDHPCIPGLNQTWLWIMILFIHCWIWLVVILWCFLHLRPSGILAFNFFVMSMFGAGIRVVQVS